MSFDDRLKRFIPNPPAFPPADDFMAGVAKHTNAGKYVACIDLLSRPRNARVSTIVGAFDSPEEAMTQRTRYTASDFDVQEWTLLSFWVLGPSGHFFFSACGAGVEEATDHILPIANIPPHPLQVANQQRALWLKASEPGILPFAMPFASVLFFPVACNNAVFTYRGKPALYGVGFTYPPGNYQWYLCEHLEKMPEISEDEAHYWAERSYDFETAERMRLG
jgi:hypothetical protein